NCAQSIGAWLAEADRCCSLSVADGNRAGFVEDGFTRPAILKPGDRETLRRSGSGSVHLCAETTGRCRPWRSRSARFGKAVVADRRVKAQWCRGRCGLSASDGDRRRLIGITLAGIEIAIRTDDTIIDFLSRQETSVCRFRMTMSCDRP